MSVCPSRCFFSSRRRHTIFDCDWSSDVCSSDLAVAPTTRNATPLSGRRATHGARGCNRLRARQTSTRVPPLRSEERREGKSVDLGGRRIIKKKKQGEVPPASCGPEQY